MVLNSRKCVIEECSSRDYCKKFYFPKNVYQGFLWLNTVKNKELDKLPYQNILRDNYFVCYRHFIDDALTTSPERVQRYFFPCLNLSQDNELRRRRRRGQTFDFSKKPEPVRKKRRLFNGCCSFDIDSSNCSDDCSFSIGTDHSSTTSLSEDTEDPLSTSTSKWSPVAAKPPNLFETIKNKLQEKMPTENKVNTYGSDLSQKVIINFTHSQILLYQVIKTDPVCENIEPTPKRFINNMIRKSEPWKTYNPTNHSCTARELHEKFFRAKRKLSDLM